MPAHVSAFGVILKTIAWLELGGNQTGSFQVVEAKSSRIL